MTPSGWLALATFWMITALPPQRAARTQRLRATGRLAASAARPTHRVPGSLLAGAAAVGVLVAVWARAGPVLTLAAAVVFGVVGRLAADARRRRAADRTRADVLTAVRVLAGDLRAGVDPANALAAAGQAAPLVADDFAAAAQRAKEGGPAQDVLLASEADEVRLVGAAWRVGAVAGCPLADVLRRVGTDLEAAAAQRRATAVALAGPRSSAAVLAGLPAVGVALGAAMGARPLAFLVNSAAGRLLCAVGIVLDALGVLWVRQIVRRSEVAA